MNNQLKNIIDQYKNGQLKVHQTDLAQKLNSEEYEKLQQAISSLGHVGEGHCRSSSNIER